MSPFVWPIRRPPPPNFTAQSGRRAMGRQMSGVDHHGRLLAVLGGQPRHYPDEDAFIAPSFPAIVEWLVGPYPLGASGHRKPLQLVKIMPLRNAGHQSGLGVRLWKARLKTRHLRIAQPEEIRHGHRSLSSSRSRSTNQINGPCA